MENGNQQDNTSGTDQKDANEIESNLKGGEATNQLNDGNQMSHPHEDTKKENGEVDNPINQETIKCGEMILEQTPDNNDINMEGSKQEVSNSKDPMDKSSPPSLTQSTLDNDALEDLFQDKTMDTTTEDAMVKELPL